MAGTMALGLLYIKWQTSLLGILIVLLGIPLYYVAQRRMK
jgi:APA family basic amino acid/polyamine antiporter